MYRYDTIDRQIVDQRVEEFRDQVRRRVNGELTEDEFKPLRLMNGLYLQLHAYMLRVAIPYGTLSSKQLNRLARIADIYDRGYGHFTTRQNIQYNWPKLPEVPDLLSELADVEMHAIQTSGNCIRNVTSDPFAGAVADEIEDPRVTCEVIRQWSTFHPEYLFLPRKFKIAVTASPKDRAALAVHDIGVQVVRREEDGAIGFKIFVGGGQGRTPHLASEIRSFVSRDHLLSYLDAILRVYNRHGRRDNIFKARIKILVAALGAEAFRDEVEQEFEDMKGDAVDVDVPDSEWARVASFFDDGPDPVEGGVPEGPTAFQEWVKANVLPHKVAGHAIAVISLKPPGGIPGDASSDQMRAVAALADRYARSEIRVTHEQNLALPHVAQADLRAVWEGLSDIGLATANFAQVTDIIACPGMDYCSLANTRSIPLAQELSRRLNGASAELGPLSINISGCINACGHHHVGNIGILGIDKRGVENFQIALGGSADEQAALARVLGPAVPLQEVPEVVERILERFVELRRDDETFIETVRRVGVEAFKEHAYATVHA
ncbi:MAG: nitrite/sulfite reductase [Myxococcota bacterium]